MEGCVLIRPDEDWLPQISAYRTAFLERGEHLHGAGSLARQEDPADWLADCRRMENPALVPDQLVPATQLMYVRPADGVLLGLVQVRHCLNDYLTAFAGHIGYSVHPEHRRQGVAKAMLGETLLWCHAMGLDRVLVTCGRENEGSRRTIWANGGVFDGERWEPDDREWVERYWIETACAEKK